MQFLRPLSQRRPHLLYAPNINKERELADWCGRAIQQQTPKVLIFVVEFRELSHLTRDLSLAEKKINVVTS